MDLQITADSIPVLDKWGWDEHWEVPEWRRWHELMVQRYGRKYANSQFLYWWGKQDSTAGPYTRGKYDQNFVNYLDKYGIDIGDALSNVALSAGSVVKNTSRGLTFITKYLGWIIAGVILTIVILVFIYLRSPADKKIATAAAAAKFL